MLEASVGSTDNGYARDCLELVYSVSGWLTLVDVDFLVGKCLSCSSTVRDHTEDDGLNSAGLRTAVVARVQAQGHRLVCNCAGDAVCTVANEQQRVGLCVYGLDVVSG